MDKSAMNGTANGIAEKGFSGLFMLWVYNWI